jgi:hypothetical protein
MIFILFYLWIFGLQVGLHLYYDIHVCVIANAFTILFIIFSLNYHRRLEHGSEAQTLLYTHGSYRHRTLILSPST